MTAAESDANRDVTRRHVASGAWSATLARLGALVEVVAQPAYVWAYGVATYGLYTVLWAAVNIVENIVDLSLPQGLQRVVPAASEEDAHGAVRFALLVTVLPACAVALAATLAAGPLAALVSAAPDDRPSLALGVALFAWALPLWTFIEVATAAVRARRAFGPEIRLRILWEQLARLGFALAFFAAGLHSLGLLLAHLASLALTAALAARLLAHHYDARLLLAAPMRPAIRRALLASGFATLPPSVARRLFSDLPPILLNLMLPGARGATAAGLFGIARKIASLPLIVRQAFSYVLAPLASAQAARDRAGIGPLYRFSVRISTALVIPLAALLVLLGRDILALFAPEAMAALPLLVILVVARAAEAVVGPATPLIEMTAHRGLPLLNSVIGLTAWALLAWWLVPWMGATGMAVAVAVGSVLVAWTAAIELRLVGSLHAFDGRMLVALGVAAAGVAAMWLGALALAPLGAGVRTGALLLLAPAAMWAGLRLGLGRGDRLALGRAGRLLRLA